MGDGCIPWLIPKLAKLVCVCVTWPLVAQPRVCNPFCSFLHQGCVEEGEEGNYPGIIVTPFLLEEFFFRRVLQNGGKRNRKGRN